MFSSKGISRRGLSLSLAVVIIAMSFVACSSGSSTTPTPTTNAASSAPSSSQPASPAASSDKVFVLKWMTHYQTPEAPTADNPILKELEKLSNVKLDINWSPQGAYSEKVNVTIASGDYPMVMLIPGNSKPLPIEVEAVHGGMFWKVEDYIKDYGWKLNQSAMKNASIDGALWGLFRERSIARDGFYYRLDWMKKLGLSEPKNLDDLYNMLKAFVQKDPDGNGQNDTGGMAQESTLGGAFAVLGPWFGLGNQWDVVDGKLLPIHMNPKYIEMLKYLKRLYDDGLMNRDFPTVSPAQRDEMMSGKYGLAMASIDKGNKSIVALQEKYPDADFTVQQVFADAPDKYIWARTGFDGKFYISKKTVPDEATLRKILDYFDVQAKNGNLLSAGIEGRHYDLVGENKITVSEKQKELNQKEVAAVAQLGFYNVSPFIEVGLPPYNMRVNAVVDDSSLTRPDPTAPFNSETYNEKGEDLRTLISDAGIKFVTGSIDEAGWYAEVERWRKSGGDQIIAEYQKIYDSLK